MKALVGTFNQEKALVGAFSVIVKIGCGTDGSICGAIWDTVLEVRCTSVLCTESCLLDSDVESGETLDEDDLLLASVCVVSVLDRGVKDTSQNVSIDVKPK